MAGKYDHKKIEKKWQEIWEKEKPFAASDQSKKEKVYVLDMFPYPSGVGIHLGHVENYTATDIYSRFKRMQDYNVLHPMGWDAFGLPAENYAIKSGVPPQKTTEEAIENFRKQIKGLGLSYDWSREIGTHTPEYYKWTQWFFLFLYKNGLAEKRLAKVNWCPKDQTVLANEQTVSESGEKGVCFRCGTKVVQKDLEQWFFKITDFADALIDDLDTVDWPESTKINQGNWIGRSEGAEIDFEISRSNLGKITIFTTRPDTLFGATYLVLAPEHPLAIELAQKSQNKDETLRYIEGAKNKTDLERQEGEKQKTGVEIKGVKAVNPANKEEIPIFVADYVLGGYGTGAIMAVPAHDERDFAFAKKFNLPIKQVIEPVFVDTGEAGKVREGVELVEREAIMAIVKHWAEDKYIGLKWKKVDWKTLITGAAEKGQTMEEGATAEIKQETGYLHPKFIKNLGRIHSKFYHVPKKVNRFAHFDTPYFELEDGARQDISPEEMEIHDVQWLSKEEMGAFLSTAAHQHAWQVFLGEPVYTSSGVLTNSGEFNGILSEEAQKKITEFVGGRLVKTYRLRDWLVSRQRYWGAPIPIVYDPQGTAHSIPDEHLPWRLPTDVEFLPKGTAPLGTSKELLERTERIFGKGWKPEIDTLDTFVCSSWYFYRFADPHNDKEFASKTKLKEWLPVDLYMGGAEHTVLHLMYARFLTKALQKYNYLEFNEPFKKLRHQGLILAEDGSKMSKSKGNVVNPDDIAAQYGADTLRLHIMFLGPIEAVKPWSTKNILGVRRFLERVWNIYQTSETFVAIDSEDVKEVLLHKTIKQISDGMESLKFNTAISDLMKFVNADALSRFDKNDTLRVRKIFLQLLAPLAPHLAHELATELGADISKWPLYDKAKIATATIKIAVQVNGKVRGAVELSAEAVEEEALALARSEPGVAKWLALGKESKAVYVAGKIISFVVR